MTQRSHQAPPPGLIQTSSLSWELPRPRRPSIDHRQRTTTPQKVAHWGEKNKNKNGFKYRDESMSAKQNKTNSINMERKLSRSDLSDGPRIVDLCREDKERVARLIQELGNESKQTHLEKARLAKERAEFEENIERLSKEQQKIADENEELKERLEDSKMLIDKFKLRLSYIQTLDATAFIDPIASKQNGSGRSSIAASKASTASQTLAPVILGSNTAEVVGGGVQRNTVSEGSNDAVKKKAEMIVSPSTVSTQTPCDLLLQQSSNTPSTIDSASQCDMSPPMGKKEAGIRRQSKRFLLKQYNDPLDSTKTEAQSRNLASHSCDMYSPGVASWLNMVQREPFNDLNFHDHYPSQLVDSIDVAETVQEEISAATHTLEATNLGSPQHDFGYDMNMSRSWHHDFSGGAPAVDESLREALDVTQLLNTKW